MLTGLIAFAILTAAAEAQAPAGYRFDSAGTRIIVDEELHWRNWVYQNNLVRQVRSPVDSTDLFEFSALGIKPIYLEAKQNYVLDRGQFEYVDAIRFRGQSVSVTGRIDALSNETRAAHVGDGDLTSFWEPARADFHAEGLRNWQILIDLGRAVFADSIVVWFPPTESAGDPPKSLTVEVSMGTQSGNSSSTNLRFDVVGRGAIVEGQRRVVFVLAPLDPADADLDGLPDFSGTFVHFVRLTVVDSDFDTKELLGEGMPGQVAYEALPDERKGLRMYQRLNVGNFVKRIRPSVDSAGDSEQTAEEIFYSLPTDQRGPIRFYKRELPRISEVEVWGPGPNVAYRPERHGGSAFEDGGRGSPLLATDGVYRTRWLGKGWEAKYSTGSIGHDELVCCTMWLDLGATFWIDRILLGMVPTAGSSWGEGVIHGWHLQGSDGTVLQALNMQTPEDFTQLQNGLAWTDLVSDVHKDNTTSQARMMQETFRLRPLRLFQQRNVSPLEGSFWSGHFNELQMYGHGYPAEVSFTSPEIVLSSGVSHAEAIDVRERRGLSEIHWEAEAIIREIDEFTGQPVERGSPLSLHPEVELLLQTRSSDTIDSLITFYEIIAPGTVSERKFEIAEARWQDLNGLWVDFRAWDALAPVESFPLREHSDGDDDGDGRANEDPIDGIDNDGDRRIDEDGVAGDVGGPQLLRGSGMVTITKHDRRRDDDGDGSEDEDPIDGKDNDGDFLIDEDGKRIPEPRQASDLEVTPYFAGWSAWSDPYRPQSGASHAAITSPSPRKFLQVRATILSVDPDVTARIRSLRVYLTPAISTDLAGELARITDTGIGRRLDDLTSAPADYTAPKDVQPLRQTPYAFFIRAAAPDPNAAEAAEGFDELLLVTPSAARLTGVRTGRVTVMERGELSSQRRAVSTTFEHAYLPDADSHLFGDAQVFRDSGGNQLMARSAGDSLIVSLPSFINAGLSRQENAIVELRFDAQTLKAGSEFLAFVRSSKLSGVSQRVESEGRDATELVDSGTARPQLLAVQHVVDRIIIPAAFSPNGDGINDQLAIELTVLTIREDRPVEVGIYDLSGRRVASAIAQSGQDRTQSGVVRFSWDGSTTSGRLAPPGIYIAQIKLDVDVAGFSAMRIVHLVF